MSDPDACYLHDDSSWQLLAEFLIPKAEGMEIQVVDRVADLLQQIGLEPGQLGQILSAINQSLQNLEGNLMPFHLRISVSGVGFEETLLEENLDRQQDLGPAGKGLGFFLVKRIVGQLQQQGSEKYRLLEVLIYRE